LLALITAVRDASDPMDPIQEVNQLFERALEERTARFRLIDVMPPMGEAPVYERTGFVRFQDRSWDGGEQRVVGDVLYGRGIDGVWTRLALDGREVIGPLWMLEVLKGAKRAEAIDLSDVEGVKRFNGLASLRSARKTTGRKLDGVGGAPWASLRPLPFSVVVGADGQAREVVVRAHEHHLTCEFWDYGVDGQVTVPPGALDLNHPARVGLRPR
jgi:hypothetical protein